MHIAIIGAGVAGLAAAWALADRSITSTIYEKSRAVGGRVATRRIAAACIDHGAQVVKAPTPALLDLVARCTDATHTPAFALPRPVWVFTRNGSIAEGDPVINAEPSWCWRSGINALGEAMAQGLDLRLGVTVAALAAGTQSAPGYRLLDAAGQTLGEADAVLLTPPGPQTAAIIGASALDAPLKAQLQTELARASYRRCISFTFAYSRRPVTPWYALVNIDRQHAIAWLACEHAKDGHAPADLGLITAQMGHDFSVAQWDTLAKGTYATPTETPLLVEVHTLIQPLLGQDLGAPLWGDVQRWRYALPDVSADLERLNGTGSGLFFAGDYTTAQGRVHLAIESGWKAAEMIADRKS